MKKSALYTLVLVSLTTLVCSCSTMRYSKLKKVEAHYTRTEKIKLDTAVSTSTLLADTSAAVSSIEEIIGLKHMVSNINELNEDRIIYHPLKLVPAFEKRNVVVQKVASKKQAEMHGGLLWTLVLILLVIWLLAMLTGGWGLGGLIYIFLVVALVILLLRLLGII
jgi:hypothetical protein